ncbi:hypothetical protein PIB30_117194 [Stylosanthes scabra]|uniref:Uncharacterized protein n=1 Tax=Stylosanthes scabra TaxID=79078 RepID=A0ABU6WBC7_9FABA|nr:hypothetical protein [Stylosanthes scabra]
MMSEKCSILFLISSIASFIASSFPIAKTAFCNKASISTSSLSTHNRMLSKSFNVIRVPTCIELITSLWLLIAFSYFLKSELHHFPTEPIGTANAPATAATTGGAEIAAATTEKIKTETKAATKMTFDTLFSVLRDFNFLSSLCFLLSNFFNIDAC